MFIPWWMLWLIFFGVCLLVSTQTAEARAVGRKEGYEEGYEAGRDEAEPDKDYDTSDYYISPEERLLAERAVAAQKSPQAHCTGRDGCVCTACTWLAARRAMPKE